MIFKQVVVVFETRAVFNLLLLNDTHLSARIHAWTTISLRYYAGNGA